MSTLEPIVLYGHSFAPKPVKVAMILEELEIPYETVTVDLTKVKEEPYISINPNGRLPAIKDPNTGITLWESGAIIEYLVEQYDTDHKLTYSSTPEKFLLKQFLHFQMSGQGPYFGQLGWFKMYHPEDVPSAKERYEGQTVRVLHVLDFVLKGKKYLVGDKATYADIAFMSWDYVARLLLGEAWNEKYAINSKYPDYAAWVERIRARPAVAKMVEVMESERLKERSG
nr:URE2 protein [Colletotrichum truncatum]KAF6799650.1 URE2 protein [Colletotrichum truncatum]